MTADNPYAPPQTEASFGKVDAIPETFWIENDTLFVKDRAILPDVCLMTGVTDGVLTRQIQTVFYHPLWTLIFYRVSFILLWVGKFHPVLLLATLISLVCHFIFKKRITVGYCLSKPAIIKITRAATINFVILVATIITYIVLRDVYRFSVNFILVPVGFVIASHLITRRITKILKIQKLENGIAQLTGIHPESLRQLARWHQAHSKPPLNPA